jgi:hypothetical protein
MKKLVTYLLFVVFTSSAMNAQLLANKQQFTHQDTLRGSITPERAWWDITYYVLTLKLDPGEFISGSNVIHYKVLNLIRFCKLTCKNP